MDIAQATSSVESHGSSGLGWGMDGENDDEAQEIASKAWNASVTGLLGSMCRIPGRDFSDTLLSATKAAAGGTVFANEQESRWEATKPIRDLVASTIREHVPNVFFDDILRYLLNRIPTALLGKEFEFASPPYVLQQMVDSRNQEFVDNITVLHNHNNEEEKDCLGGSSVVVNLKWTLKDEILNGPANARIREHILNKRVGAAADEDAPIILIAGRASDAGDTGKSLEHQKTV